MGANGRSDNEQGVAPQAMLDAWAHEYRTPLLKYFQKRAPKTVEPDDLVQEVFVRLAKHADLASIEQVQGYLFQTAASVLADRFRRDGRKPAFIETFDDDAHGAADLSPERVYKDRQGLDALVRGLNALPERTRHIFVLYHFEGMRQKDIAAGFDMPISTVEKHMARANRFLADCVGRKR